MEPLYIFARFEPKPGKLDELRAVIETVIPLTRAEPGCVRINFFESIREPFCFVIHSMWQDEAAFEFHATLSHTERFVTAASELISHPFQATRTHEIG